MRSDSAECGAGSCQTRFAAEGMQHRLQDRGRASAATEGKNLHLQQTKLGKLKCVALLLQSRQETRSLHEEQKPTQLTLACRLVFSQIIRLSHVNGLNKTLFNRSSRRKLMLVYLCKYEAMARKHLAWGETKPQGRVPGVEAKLT